MSNTRGAAEFLGNLWRTIDIDTIPDPISEKMNLALDVMYDVDGKPSSSLVVQVYDALMQTPQTSVYCHAMMLTRIISSTDWVANRLVDGEKILDLGTCTGHQVLYWANLHTNSQFLGIDVSSNAINVANQWKDNLSLEHVEFRIDNYFRPDFDEGTNTLDVIVNCFTMETIQDHLSIRCALPDWMLRALKPDGRIIAVLTVANWTILNQIIYQWRSQGLRLNEIEMIPTEDGGVHPGLVMSRIGDDLQLDIRDEAARATAELKEGLWKIHNPVDKEGISVNPFDHTREDLSSLANQIQFPMRIETWVAEAPDLNSGSLPANPYQPVIQLRHPDWHIDATPLALWMDWHEVEGEPEPRYQIRLYDCPEPSENLNQKLAELNYRVSSPRPEMESEGDGPFAQLCEKIEDLNQLLSLINSFN
ncbi:MAG: class I SAM-dependent methyltransferase [Candidatus Thalassarchaeaceae archaeon]|nr:class I SAM-dependent methyltransferase [Candidatus Thalassarchaeaceae archaeon]